jgi:tRNA threonylcarbamoyladenosine biosynthesis protein TsaE
VLQTRSSDETRQLASAIAPLLGPGDVLVLSGELGAGKTTLVQGVARGVGYEGAVASPTFTLVREYRNGRVDLLHVDVYRLDRVQDVVDLALEERIDEGAVLVIEWGDAVESLLPPDHLVIEMTTGDDAARRIRVRGVGPTWSERWERLERDLEGWAA